MLTSELGECFHVDAETAFGWSRLDPPFATLDAALAVFEVMSKGGQRLRVRGPAFGKFTGTIYAESSADGNVFRYPNGRPFNNHI